MTNKVEQIKDGLQGISLDVVEWLREVVPKGKDFVVEQTPVVIQEIITREIAMSALWICIGLAVASGGYLAIKLGIKLMRKEKPNPDEFMPCYIVGGFLCVIALFITVSQIDSLVYVLSAPKLFILEYLKDLL